MGRGGGGVTGGREGGVSVRATRGRRHYGGAPPRAPAATDTCQMGSEGSCPWLREPIRREEPPFSVTRCSSRCAALDMRYPPICAGLGSIPMTTQATQIWALCASTSRDEPNVVGMADREVDDALARSFLADLPPELVGRLRAEGERADYPAGTTVYRAGSSSQAGLVVGGLLRVYLMSVEGPQVPVPYGRPGDVLGVAVLVGGPASTSVQAVEASSLFRISARMLTAAA